MVLLKKKNLMNLCVDFSLTLFFLICYGSDIFRHFWLFGLKSFNSTVPGGCPLIENQLFSFRHYTKNHFAVQQSARK